MIQGAPMVIVVVWFFVDAHKWFKGPKINIEVCSPFSPSLFPFHAQLLFFRRHLTIRFY